MSLVKLCRYVHVSSIFQRSHFYIQSLKIRTVCCFFCFLDLVQCYLFNNGWWARKRKRKKHSHSNVMPGRAPVSPATQANTLRRQGRRQQRSLLTGAVLPL